MKKTVLLLCLCFAGFGSFSQKPLFADQPKDSVVHLDPRMQQNDFVPGEILIRYRDEAEVQNLKAGEIIQTGITSIDSLYNKYRVSAQQKLFPEEQRLKSKVILRSYNGKEFEQPSLHNIYKLSLPQESNLFEAINELKNDPNVIYAEPNYILSVTNDRAVTPPMTESEAKDYLSSLAKQNLVPGTFPFLSPAAPSPGPLPVKDSKGSIPDDPLYSQQWYIPAVHADAVWDTVSADSAKVVAILDTGVDWLHPDLADQIWTNPGEIPGNGIDDDGNGYVDDVRGWDWINNDNNPMDDNSHGTHVAGIAAARQNNGIGIAGVGKNAKVMALKVLQSTGRGDAATIATAINYAKNKGADVINMSFGSYARSYSMEMALEDAYATSVLVAAAGNDNKYLGPGLDCMFQPSAPFFPAALSYVLGTQVSSSCGMGFSNYDIDGPAYSQYPDQFNYELNAPGTNMLSTIPNGGYRVYQGTSMAAPVLSGAVCLYKALHPYDSQELMWGNLINTSGAYIDIDSAIRVIPSPKLMFVNRTVLDTLTGDDHDGVVDAGERIQVWFKVRNTWGQCDSVMAGLRLGEFEDTTTAQILVKKAFIGSTSPYAMRSNERNPFIIHISPDVANDRDIRFTALLWYPGLGDTVTLDFTLTAFNGSELSGILMHDTTLTAGKYWLISNNLRIAEGVTVTVAPGAHVEINAQVDNRGFVSAVGKPDSIIYFKGPFGGNNLYKYADIDLRNGEFSTTNPLDHCRMTNISLPGWTYNRIYFPLADNCLFENINTYFYSLFMYSAPLEINNSIIRNGTLSAFTYNSGTQPSFNHCIFDNIGLVKNWQSQNCLPNGSASYSVFNNIYFNSNYPPEPSRLLPASDASVNNSFLDNGKWVYFVTSVGGGSYCNYPDQYWGTSRPDKIRKKYWDFVQDVTLPYLIYEPKLTAPSDSCHGHVWKVLINGRDPQDEVIDPLGAGNHRFDVYFNREMDTAFIPRVSFGVRYPYVQQAVTDSGHWDPTHRIWTAWKKIGLYTGDGINRVRVARAKEANGWDFEIPVEAQRFEFLISAAGSSSMEFMAQAGIGKVSLEWNDADIPDLLGFNIYRFENITDTTYTAPVIINSSLVTDTTFTDFAVTPGQRYWYYYKVVNTDFREADSSKFVNAVPYDASVGDANGDESVNVLDIMAVIAYMLGQDPQPFLFDAADVNDDNAINILDVIGIVNRIIHPEKSGFDITGTNPAFARIRLESDRIILQSDGQIASMQFELTGEGLDKIRLAEPPAGFELAYGIVQGKLLGILYSSSRKAIPAGTIDLVKIVGESAVPEWGAILAGDGNGNIVPVLKETPAGNAKPEMFLQAYPNPFSQKVTFSFRLTSDAHVKISVYNMAGKLVTVLADKEMKEGMNYIDWNGTNFNRRVVPSGIYLCRLEGTARDGSAFHRETRIVYIN